MDSLHSKKKKMPVVPCFCFNLPELSRMMALSLVLKRASVLLRINSTTTDWIRTSMNAAVPLKQADSICLDLKHSYRTSEPISQLWTTETCPSSFSTASLKRNCRANGANVAFSSILPVIAPELPEEVRCPDDCKVFSVHVSDGAEGGQVGEVSHEVLQSPVSKVNRNI